MSFTTLRLASNPSLSFKPVPIVVDLTDNHTGTIDNTLCHSESSEDEEKYSEVPPSPIRAIPAGRSLRRKKDLAQSGRRFSLPPTAPVILEQMMETTPDLTMAPTPPLTSDSGKSFASNEVPAELAAASMPHAHQRTQSQPVPPVKLGHPSRPYYTAIRPRPISVIGLSSSIPVTIIADVEAKVIAETGSAPSSRPTSVSVSSPDAVSFSSRRDSVFLDVQIQDNGEVILPTPSALSPPVSLGDPVHQHYVPFSVFAASNGGSASGEAEMRMASGDAAYTFVAPKCSTKSPAVSRAVTRVAKSLKRMLSFSR